MEHKTLDISQRELIESLVTEGHIAKNLSATITAIQLEHGSVKIQISSEMKIYSKKQQKFLAMNLADMDISIRLHDYFKKIGIATGADVLKISENDWGAFRDFGVKSMQELRTLVAIYDLSLE